MELRKVEQELDNLSSEWKAVRRKNPVFPGGGSADDTVPSASSLPAGAALQLPSLKELSSRIKDEDIYMPLPPLVESDDGEGEDGGKMEVDGEGEENAKNDVSSKAVGAAVVQASAGANDSKTNAISVGDGSSSEKHVSDKNNQQKQVHVDWPSDDDDEEVMTTKQDATPEEVLSVLESLKERLIALRPKIDKFGTRLIERDPVTKKLRYGEKTEIRVRKAIRQFKSLELGLSFAFNDPEFSNLNPSSASMQQQTQTLNDNSSAKTAGKDNASETDTISIVSNLRTQIQQHQERIQAESEAKKSKEQLEAQRLAQEKLDAEQQALEQQRLEEEKKREEERLLAQRAEEARRRRVEEEQRAIEAEREADRQLLGMVPVKGPDGVRMQIGKMREALKDDKKALDVALGSLYTLFDQIVRKPEEVNFRRIRRDHPKFVEDIGRHVGGREVLIAAGFRLEKLDGVPSFFSREPHIETDMDGWSDWFDGLKKTLEILEEEMIK